jgi:glycosyltransferase involved in cell wall biosynthesis
MSNKSFRIAMIPSSTDGVNYYRLAAWAFEMRKYKNTIVDLLWFKYEIDPTRPHPWQEDMRDQSPSFYNPYLTTGQYIRASIDRACELADIVVWHPMYYDWSFDFFLEMQHKHQKPFVVEMDDNYVDVPQWNEAYHSFKNGSGFRRIGLDSMRNADALFVTTPHLAETYAEMNDNIYLIENSLDFRGDRKFVGWDNVSVRKHRGTRIGWIGGRAHFNDLMLIAPALREVLVRNTDATLCLVNSALKPSCEALGIEYPFKDLKNVHYSDHSVAINRYAKFAASFGFDIGIAPLVDCNFNRSKSNLRWLEYSALKIPCVASNIGHYKNSIRNGVDGLLVVPDDLADWVSSLNQLIGQPLMREVIGSNAYKRVKKHFNVEKNSPKYLRLLKKLANSSIQDEIPDQEAVYA